jgi:hypothetical protein
MTEYTDARGCDGAEERHRDNHGYGGGESAQPRRPMMPRRGTIWIPSSAVVPGVALSLPSQEVDLDRTMA